MFLVRFFKELQPSSVGFNAWWNEASKARVGKDPTKYSSSELTIHNRGIPTSVFGENAEPGRRLGRAGPAMPGAANRVRPLTNQHSSHSFMLVFLLVHWHSIFFLSRFKGRIGAIQIFVLQEFQFCPVRFGSIYSISFVLVLSNVQSSLSSVSVSLFSFSAKCFVSVPFLLFPSIFVVSFPFQVLHIFPVQMSFFRSRLRCPPFPYIFYLCHRRMLPPEAARVSSRLSRAPGN